MAERYRDSIEAYCRESGIAIPAGFYRASASRYAAIDLESEPHKLIARTWFTQEDVAYYLTHLAPGKAMRVLDFRDRCNLVFNGSSGFQRGDAF